MSENSLSVPVGPRGGASKQGTFCKVLRWLQEDIIDGGRLPLLCCLVAFILTFFVTRTFARIIRRRTELGLPAKWWQPRNIYIGSKHIHHVVVGVVLVMVSGVTMVSMAINRSELQFALVATVFGIGAALVLDEYALILHLSDVYWEEDGRTSVDAVFAAVAVGGLLVMGLHPLMFLLALFHDTHSPLIRAAVISVIVLTLPLAVVVVLKGKVWTGLIGMFLVPLLFIGAIRLSRPHAPWARWRYTRQLDKMRLALERERRLRRPVVQAKLWLQCAIAGTPQRPDPGSIDAELDRRVHAAPPPTGAEPALVASESG